MLGALGKLVYYQRRLGAYEGLRWHRFIAENAAHPDRNGRFTVQPPGIAYPLQLRRGNTSDPDVFHHTFLSSNMAFTDVLRAPALILDLGANAGYTSAFLLNKFPKARLIAVEPDAENVAMCQANLAPYGTRAQVVHGGVWPIRTRLTVVRGLGDGLDWSVEVREAAPGEPGDVDAWDIPSLLAMAPGLRVGLLKVDIEGSEGPLFARNADAWIGLVDNICIELHSAECNLSVFNALRGFDHEYRRHNEWNCCFNLRAK